MTASLSYIFCLGGTTDLVLSFLAAKAKRKYFLKISFAINYKVKTSWLLNETAASLTETREFLSHEFSNRTLWFWYLSNILHSLS